MNSIPFYSSYYVTATQDPDMLCKYKIVTGKHVDYKFTSEVKVIDFYLSVYSI